MELPDHQNQVLRHRNVDPSDMTLIQICSVIDSLPNSTGELAARLACGRLSQPTDLLAASNGLIGLDGAKPVSIKIPNDRQVPQQPRREVSLIIRIRGRSNGCTKAHRPAEATSLIKIRLKVARCS